MIIRKYEVLIRDNQGADILIGRYFRRKRAWHEVGELRHYGIPNVFFRDRTAPARRTKAFVNGH